MTQRGGSPEFPYYEDEIRAPAPLPPPQEPEDWDDAISVLRSIEGNDSKNCACDHKTEECCANFAEYKNCPHCTAGKFLRTLDGSDNPTNVCKFHGSNNQKETCTQCFTQGKNRPAALAGETRQEVLTVTGRALKDIAYWLKWFEDAWRGEMEVNKTLHARIAQLGTILPKTFFADRDIAFRLERMVDSWRRAIEANHLLETRAETAEAALTQAQAQLDWFRNELDALATANERLQDERNMSYRESLSARAEVTKLMKSLRPFAYMGTQPPYSADEKFANATRVYEQVKKEGI